MYGKSVLHSRAERRLIRTFFHGRRTLTERSAAQFSHEAIQP
jgi:hypothetical protein